MARIRVIGQQLLRLCGQRVEAPPHSLDASSKPNPRVARNRDHAVSPCICPTTDANDVGPSTRIRRPSDSAMSTRCAKSAGSGSATTSFIRAKAVGLSRQDASISIERKTPARAIHSFGNGPLSSRENCGSLSDLKIRFAFIE